MPALGPGSKAGWSRWWSRASAEDRSHDRVAPHHQVQLLWLITLLVVAAEIVTGSLALGTAENDVKTAMARLVPAATQLATAARDFAAGSAGLLAVTQSADPSARAATINQLADFDTAANAAWSSYERLTRQPARGGKAPGADRAGQPAALDGRGNGALLDVELIGRGHGLHRRHAARPAASPGRDSDRLYQTRINAVITTANHAFAVRQHDLLIVSIIVVIITMISFSIVTRSIRRRYRIQVEEVRRSDLESGLQRALEMVRTEQDCYTLVQHAIEREFTDAALGVPRRRFESGALPSGDHHRP